MKTYLFALLTALSLPGLLLASQYRENMDRIGARDPEVVVHLDLQKDFDVLGKFLTDAYLAYLQSGQAGAAQLPFNFQAVFDRFGLSSLDSVTLASEPVPGRGFQNQSLFRFNGSPAGCFLLAGSENHPFSIAGIAPADADVVAELGFDGPILVEILRNLAGDVMGDLGRGLIDAQLAQPLNEEGLTLQDVVDQLRTNLLLAVRIDEDSEASTQPAVAALQGDFVCRLAGLAGLMDSLAPILAGAGFEAGQGAASAAWKLNVPAAGMPLSVFIEPAPDSGDLLVYLRESSRDWFLQPPVPISSVEEFARATSGLPTEGVTFWYASERISRLQVESLGKQMAEGNPYEGLVEVTRNFLMRFTGSQAGCAFLEADAYRVVSWQPTSYKTNSLVAALSFPIGMLAAMPPPEAGAEEAAEDSSSPD